MEGFVFICLICHNCSRNIETISAMCTLSNACNEMHRHGECDNSGNQMLCCSGEKKVSNSGGRTCFVIPVPEIFLGEGD